MGSLYMFVVYGARALEIAAYICIILATIKYLSSTHTR